MQPINFSKPQRAGAQFHSHHITVFFSESVMCIMNKEYALSFSEEKELFFHRITHCVKCIFTNILSNQFSLYLDIRITRLCNLYPVTPHFYIVKLGFTGVYIIFIFLL